MKLQKTQGRAGIRVEKELFLKFPAVMKFSPSGKWFSLLDAVNSTIHIVDSSDIYKCFENIDEGKYNYTFDFR